MNETKFVISGEERRKVKKRFNFLKSYIRTFWQYHQLDKDMYSFYGGNAMSDSDAQIKLDEAKEEITNLDILLKETIS